MVTRTHARWLLAAMLVTVIIDGLLRAITTAIMEGLHRARHP